MTEKWTGNCKAQEILQKLFDEGQIKGDSTPAFVRSLDPDTFDQYSDAVFNLHLRKTKMANRLKNTAKRGKQTSSMLSFHEQIECPQLGKRKPENSTGSVEADNVAHEDLQNPGYLVCDYFDFKTKETFVGVAVCLMWGMKSCKIEVLPSNSKVAILSYKWPPGLENIESKFELELKMSANKNRVFAKMQAFAYAMDKQRDQQREIPTSTQRINLPLEVVPQTFNFNAGDAILDADVFVVEFTVASNKLSKSIVSVQA
ncbi:hypothetical protein LEN26_005005 [Aphanomyces euteiches]|nr:hypothetical protein AeMF1_006633 [Aphanomyces euteiches]KAH9144896.1 hypothetical protein LEN26_005005 [Aphanomyces euteiches]KAH9182024.1 hypothetical protein AeNC1_016001 [Aphanomyces euteiches]